MGKGDKRTKRGKIWLGSYGNCRKRKSSKKRVNNDSNQTNKETK